MSINSAEIVVKTVELYLACGAAFAAIFVWTWIGVVDPAARQGTLGFRLLVFPGVVMLWPVLALRLARGATEPPDEWTAHRAAARRVGCDRKTEVLR